ncbi:MAG: tetratricopeptide repeat protein [Ignavibacteriae bacterium]|nr:tetratricopeptide repeat protein [Ignavibacteriota bacterium]
MIRNIFFIVMMIFTLPLYSQNKDEMIIKGLDHMYHMRLDSAKIEYDRVISLNPKNPEGYFFLVLLQWWRININKEDISNDENFFRAVDKVIDIADNVLDNNSNDDNAMFYKGGAIGYRGLVHALRENWLKAAEDGRRSLNLFEEASKINPSNKDVMFGNGVYNYFAEYIPDRYPFLKPLLILFPSGDKNKGLLQIKETAMNSKFGKVEAKFILSYLYLKYEKNFTEAEIYSKDLSDNYPENPQFARYLYNSYVGAGKFQEAIEGWQKILQFASEGKFGFNTPVLLREANYYLGFSYMYTGNNEEAKKYLLKSEELSSQIDKDATMIKAFTLLWLGVVNGRLGDKSKAREYFDKVLEMDNFGDSHDQAEKYKARL